MPTFQDSPLWGGLKALTVGVTGGGSEHGVGWAGAEDHEEVLGTQQVPPPALMVRNGFFKGGDIWIKI